MIKKLIITVVLLVVVGLGVLYVARNMLVEKAVETGSSYALGVDTDLGSASLDLGGGGLELNSLEIKNPEGYSAEHFLTLERGVLDVATGSILDDMVVVDSFVIEGVRLNIEQIDGGGNYRELLNHAAQIDLGSSSSGSQKIRIDRVALRDIEVTGLLTLAGRQQLDKTFRLDDFTLSNVGSETGGSVGEITRQILDGVVTRALASGGGLKEMVNSKVSEATDEAKDKLEDAARDKLKGLLGN